MIAYIYCDYNFRQEQTVLSLLSNIVQQILQNLAPASLPAEVKTLYALHAKYNTRPTLTQVKDVLRTALSLLASCLIVVDALDELAESETALQFMSELSAFRPQLKVLCTSRYSVDFDNFFSTSERMDISAQDGDIQFFLGDYILTHGSLSRHVKSDPSLGDAIMQTIGNETQGM